MSTEATAVGTDPLDMVSSVGRHWGWVLVFGLLTAGLGVCLVVWPKRSILVVAVLLGLYLIISGIFQIVAGIAARDVDGGMRALAVISGVLSLLLGLVALRSWAHAAWVLVLLIGFGWLFRGIGQLIGAISNREAPARGLQMFLGGLSIVAAIVLLAWPAPTLTVVAVVAGLWLILLGVLEIFTAFQIRRLPAV